VFKEAYEEVLLQSESLPSRSSSEVFEVLALDALEPLDPLEILDPLETLDSRESGDSSRSCLYGF